ncbi:flagellar export chaperone FliS [Paenibacillus sp. GCM10012307]|uniref:Flagellar secretion chaperone FliS n=1 Tax=Paenibacillus roseus TaxID=2798579 RepID=A0A934J361_9BACL|nr:flagellar export chaperone FliS [Paenibacillus roseus]MBJ6361935.1 flagellar export chaperone FliS [Paenibacillus roseus]
MITSPYDKYRQSSVQTSTPGQLLLMLYDGAIRFVRGGIGAITDQDYQKANTLLGKAQSIISELRITLDYSYEISQQLSSLYEYMNHLLIQANVKKETGPAEEVLGYLIDLRESFAQAAKSAGNVTQDSVHANG